ncbi:MAG: aminodeoxychorismate/anthranilate synthase component II [Dehalococcoidia bacterium]|nr:aminodeoxychorismate/anthranilate synthase component II [Dehalococcoidia bacterium]HRC62978.1 aminodeoxychorismate/anthranilate synthase component II [Dehalococcoidia bacterium]
MLLLIDNYDSFTYNLYQYLAELGADVRVHRNDEVSVEDCLAMRPERIVISPGPCTPDEAGISVDLIKAAAGQVPLLGVCLGHQAIGQAFGADVVSAGEIMHGKTSMVTHDGKGVFAGLPNPFEAIRYHSLAIAPDSVPEELEVSATSESGVIMGIRHRTMLVEGVQFHPESIMTKVGHDLLRNFLEMRMPAPAGAAS